MAEGQVRFSEDVWSREGTDGKILPVYNCRIGKYIISDETEG